GVGFFEERFGDFLGAAGVVVGLFCFAVFVDGAFALAEQIENFAEIDVAPNFGPFFGRLGDSLQRFAERVRGGLIIFLVEECFAHAEICERAIGLNRESALILCDGVVILALLGEFFAASDGGTC